MPEHNGRYAKTVRRYTRAYRHWCDTHQYLQRAWQDHRLVQTNEDRRLTTTASAFQI